MKFKDKIKSLIKFKTIIKFFTFILLSILIILNWTRFANDYIFNSDFPVIFFDYITSWKMLLSMNCNQTLTFSFLIFNLIFSNLFLFYIIKKINWKISFIVLISIIFYFLFYYNSNIIRKYINGYMMWKYDQYKIIKSERKIKRIKLLKNLKVKCNKKPNIIMIVLESVDTVWISNEFKGLMPNLKYLLKNSINFCNIKQSHYGYDSEHGMEDVITVNRSPVHITDILNKINYNQIAMTGFEYSFLQYGDFLKKYNYNQIISKNISDTILFENAFCKYKSILQSKKSTCLTIVTKDTHSKKSYWPYKFKIKNNEKRLLTTYKTLDKSLFKFINNIRKIDKNVIIAIFNDHYAWPNALQHRVKKVKNRRMVFFIINGKIKTINKKGTTANIGATLLSVAGINHNINYIKKYNLYH